MIQILKYILLYFILYKIDIKYCEIYKNVTNLKFCDYKLLIIFKIIRKS